jgi:2-iminobutanoate/2-iminopropanoate deaminase
LLFLLAVLRRRQGFRVHLGVGLLFTLTAKRKNNMKIVAWIVPVLLTGASAAAWAASPGIAKDVIATKEAPAAVGPYSQAIRAGNMVFLAGQIPINPKTGQTNTGTIEEQATQVLENLKAVLAADGMSMDNVVSTTVFVKDLNDFAKLNAVYGTYFKDKPPARATVQVQRLPKDVAVEISAIAVR